MATYYISPIGNDSTGAGTSVSPWQTLSKAFSSSTTNDTILYDSANGNNTWVTQGITSFRNISSYGGGTAILDGGTTTNMWYGSFAVTNVQFQNYVGTVAFLVNDTNGIETFTNCKFVNIGANFGMFEIDPGSTNPSLFLEACLFDGCYASGAASGPFYLRVDPTPTGSITMSMINCTIYSNVATGITMSLLYDGTSGASTTLTLTNNIIWNANGVNTSFLRSGSATPTYAGSNNDFLGYSSAPSLTGNIAVDPLFVDPGNHNFNLRPSSPCRDAGTAI